MYQGLRLSRPWLGLILIAFCLPLFVGLGRADLETDEAIYSFAVDHIVAAGDWLEPKSSPSETQVFLEKPPLKFWIVAAPIRAGLLPRNEFGLRFWDAVAGGASFLYVFAIGTLLAGPVCGAVAVLVLFVHGPLVFVHGLRTNNMEAALVLSYCAGVFHFLRWSAAAEPRARRIHAMAVGLAFVLGFMTKFVAALFLPLVLAIAAVASPVVRRKVWRDVHLWGGVSALVVVLCAPWFLYAYARFGRELWDTMLAAHVYERMTSYLDPTHVQPWHFYLESMSQEFRSDGVGWLVGLGLVVLVIQTIRRRWFEGAVVLLWALVPLVIISLGSSKLYHYAYPFLPPIALAAGYLVALTLMLAPVPLRRLLEHVEDAVAARAPAMRRLANQPWMRYAAWSLLAAGTLLVCAAVWNGDAPLAGREPSRHVRFVFHGVTLFTSSGVLRPLLLMLAAVVLARLSAQWSLGVVALLVFTAMPISAYRGAIDRLDQGRHPIRTASECVQRVAAAGAPSGVRVNVPEGVWHPIYYYLRRVQPWTPATEPLGALLEHDRQDPAAAVPLLVSDRVYRDYIDAEEHAGRPRPPAPPMVSFLNTLLLLPGPYAICSSEAPLTTPEAARR